jgi:hypothetical protein
MRNRSLQCHNEILLPCCCCPWDEQIPPKKSKKNQSRDNQLKIVGMLKFVDQSLDRTNPTPTNGGRGDLSAIVN